MSRRNRGCLLAVVGMLIAAFLGYAPLQKANAAIGLIYFHADGLDGEVYVDWQTGTELDNAGFFIQRSLQQAGGYTRISPFIPGEGTTISGAYYIYRDFDVNNGTTYWYRLESIDLNNQSEYHDPVSATPQVEGSQTATLTPAKTSTATAQTGTPTQTGIATLTRTPTLFPSATSTSGSGYPAPATSTQQPASGSSNTSSTQTPTESLQATLAEPTATYSPTATLLPLPELTLQFPPDAVAMSAARFSDPQSPAPAIENRDFAGRLLLVGMIIVIWAMLGTWFFLSMRKFQ